MCKPLKRAAVGCTFVCACWQTSLGGFGAYLSPAIASGTHRRAWLAAKRGSGKELPSANTLRKTRLFFHYRSVCVAEVPEDTFPVYSPVCLLAVKGLEGEAKAA